MIEKVKEHVKKYKIVYSCGATAVVTAGITCIIMRDISSQRISRGISVTAKRGISVLGKSVVRDSERISRAIGVTAGRDIVVTRKSVLNNVSYILSNRQGAPSWVVRCLETGNIFPSQRTAALGMELSESHISAHLNGIRDSVNGYTFERICMAA